MQPMRRMRRLPANQDVLGVLKPLSSQGAVAVKRRHAHVAVEHISIQRRFDLLALLAAQPARHQTGRRLMDAR